MKKKPTAKRYSEAFKRQVVQDLERHKTTEAEVRRKYGIGGGSTIEKWRARYGNARAGSKKVIRGRSVASRRLLILERQKRELEQAVARLTVEKVALESLVEEAQAQLGVDLKKTFGLGR